MLDDAGIAKFKDKDTRHILKKKLDVVIESSKRTKDLLLKWPETIF